MGWVGCGLVGGALRTHTPDFSHASLKHALLKHARAMGRGFAGRANLGAGAGSRRKETKASRGRALPADNSEPPLEGWVVGNAAALARRFAPASS